MKTYGPYSPAVVTDGLIFVSGQIGIVPGEKSAAADVEAQTDQCLKNLAEVLKSVDSDVTKVVKTTIYLKNMSDFAAVNEVYAKTFGDIRPARATVEVASLPHIGETELLIEIEAIAQK